MSTLGVVVVPEGGPGAETLLGGLSLLDRAVAALRSCPDVDHVLVFAAGERPPDGEHVGAEHAGAEHADAEHAGAALAHADVVVLHDASFPLVDVAVVAAVLGALGADPGAVAAVAVLPVTDTLKRVAPDGAVLATVDRTALRVAGSPQAYRPHLLPRDVLPAPTAAASLSHPADAAAPYRSAGTAVLSHLADAAALPLALVEAGRRVVLVDAPPAAFRVRTDLDLLAARALLGETLPAPARRTPGGVSPRDEGSTAR